MSGSPNPEPLGSLVFRLLLFLLLLMSCVLLSLSLTCATSVPVLSDAVFPPGSFCVSSLPLEWRCFHPPSPLGGGAALVGTSVPSSLGVVLFTPLALGWCCLLLHPSSACEESEVTISTPKVE